MSKIDLIFLRSLMVVYAIAGGYHVYLWVLS